MTLFLALKESVIGEATSFSVKILSLFPPSRISSCLKIAIGEISGLNYLFFFSSMRKIIRVQTWMIVPAVRRIQVEEWH